MCTVNIKIDNEKVRRINPSLNSNENIERWVQHYVDEFIDSMSSDTNRHAAPNTHTASEMRAILRERIRRAEAGEEREVSNAKVFSQIDKRYGF